MTRHVTHREIPEAHRASEHLDNERTFLAWVRTNIALSTLGLVVARLSPVRSGMLARACSALWSSEGPGMPRKLVKGPTFQGSPKLILKPHRDQASRTMAKP